MVRRAIASLLVLVADVLDVLAALVDPPTIRKDYELDVEQPGTIEQLREQLEGVKQENGQRITRAEGSSARDRPR